MGVPELRLFLFLVAAIVVALLVTAGVLRWLRKGK